MRLTLPIPLRDLSERLRGGLAARLHGAASLPRLAARLRGGFVHRDLLRLRVEASGGRLLAVGVGFALVYGAIGAKLVRLGVSPEPPSALRKASGVGPSHPRPDIVDRNGEVLATDVTTWSVFAEPRNLIDKDEATELLTAVLPDLNARELREKLSSGKGFAWVKREVSSKQRTEIYRLGLPGVGFLQEKKRVYPNGTAAAHVLGAANVDNQGISGIEKWIDGQGIGALAGAGLVQQSTDLKPVQLSIDLRVQHALRDEVAHAMDRFKAKAAAGAILDVESGEVVALASLPDFDPNVPADALKPDNINRLAVGVYEMGSTFKALTTAMALDAGKVTVNSQLDARSGLRHGRFTIHDYHAKNRVLALPEVFIYSSNVGTARMGLMVGVEGHKSFLRRAGQLTALRTELPETAMPIVPARWGELNTMTISFGHGLAVAPLQAMMATAALVNGGMLIPPTFLKRTPEEAAPLAVRLVKPETSETMRFLMRLNAEKGSAGKANIPGYYVGGKTGTAEKVIRGRYSKNRLFTTFMAVAPSDKPRYLFLVTMDEPQATPETHGYATSGWNAAPTAGRIVERVAPLLGLTPRFEFPASPFPTVAKQGWSVAR